MLQMLKTHSCLRAFIIIITQLLLLTSSLAHSKHQHLNHSGSITKEELERLDDVTLELVREALLVPRWSFREEEPVGEEGENGTGFKMLNETLDQKSQEEFWTGWWLSGFDQYASDRISLHRSLPDVRDEECKSLQYRQELPKASVIIIFHNEAWSALLRTVHSVLDRSAPHLVQEVILVDDFSGLEHLKKPLDDYVARLGGKVRVVRGKRREGLIRARLLGASVAIGPVLVFLDSHCECTMGWLEPLLDRIAANATNVVTPIIDVLGDGDLRYKRLPLSSVAVGGFNWKLRFNHQPVPERELKRRKSPVEPIRSATLANSMYAIKTSFFRRLGGYDWKVGTADADNLELSFKVWMCGGAIEQVLCSRIGSLLRLPDDFSFTAPLTKQASARVAEVWMDDFKKYYYRAVAGAVSKKKKKIGSIKSRKKLREELKCHSFQWYLDNIFPELFIPGNALLRGEIHSKFQVKTNETRRKICLSSSLNNLAPAFCDVQESQVWMLSQVGEIRKEDERCLDYKGDIPCISACAGRSVSKKWVYHKENHTIQAANTQLCLSITNNLTTLFLQHCNNFGNQTWYWRSDSETVVNS